MIDVWNGVAGPFLLATGLLLTVGALLSRFGLRTFISPSRIDERPEVLVLGTGFTVLGIALVANVRADAFWSTALNLSAMALFVIGLVLQVKSTRARSKKGR